MPCHLTRRHFLATSAGLLLPPAASAQAPPRSELGLQVYSYSNRIRYEKDRGVSDPRQFIPFARERGFGAVQMPLGVPPEADARAIRELCERQEVVLEGIIPTASLREEHEERLRAELAAARRCGVEVVRTVVSPGRRYESFHSAEEYDAFAREAARTLRRIAPIAERHKVAIAVENHKDFRADELRDLVKAIASESVGVCVDTGNNIALLEDPRETIATLAPVARSVHLKDMAMEESPDGFRIAEVPLGQGRLDLKTLIALLRQHQPRIRFFLEMITRDPLPVACLGEGYWATLEKVPGRDLARTLARVRAGARSQPLPRISSLSPVEQMAKEEQNVRESIRYAVEARLMG